MGVIVICLCFNLIRAIYIKISLYLLIFSVESAKLILFSLNGLIFNTKPYFSVTIIIRVFIIPSKKIPAESYFDEIPHMEFRLKNSVEFPIFGIPCQGILWGTEFRGTEIPWN